MKDKKGFTLVELLAVIVVLGIIMAIAAGTVTSVIKNARKNSFINSHKMLVKEIKTRIQKNKLGIDPQTVVCDEASDVEAEKCSKVYDISADDFEMKVEAAGSDYTFSLIGKGSFADIKASDVKNSLANGVTSFDNLNEHEVLMAFDNNAQVITDAGKIEAVFEERKQAAQDKLDEEIRKEQERLEKESKDASFEYFELVKQIAIAHANGTYSESMLPSKQLNVKVNGYATCEDPTYNRLAVFFKYKDYDTEYITTDDEVNYYNKIDLGYLDEYHEEKYDKAIDNSVWLIYGVKDYQTTLRKFVSVCYYKDPETNDVKFGSPIESYIKKAYPNVTFENFDVIHAKSIKVSDGTYKFVSN